MSSETLMLLTPRSCWTGCIFFLHRRQERPRLRGLRQPELQCATIAAIGLPQYQCTGAQLTQPVLIRAFEESRGPRVGVPAEGRKRCAIMLDRQILVAFDKIHEAPIERRPGRV